MPATLPGIRGFILLIAAAAGIAAGSICSSNATVDPPNTTRDGDDFASVPLAAPNNSLSACIALCCDTPTCAAFSYNNPQPERTCIGEQCCEQGGVCCMLKNAVPPPINNTYGPAVTTGTAPSSKGVLPGPTPPFPTSTLITNVTFGNVSWWGNGQNQGDTWPSMWAADGTLYAWACDNLNSSPSACRLDPPLSAC